MVDGLFVLAIPNAVSTVLPYVAAIAIGSLVIGFGYAMIKTGKAEVATASAVAAAAAAPTASSSTTRWSRRARRNRCATR